MRIYFTFLFFILYSILMAQQLPLISAFSDNLGSYNPGAVSIEYFTNNSNEYTTQIGVSHRTQWIGLDGAPKTQNLFFNKLIREEYRTALTYGGSIFNDQVGPISTTALSGRIAAVFGNKLKEGVISAGISIGLNNYTIDFNDIRFDKPELVNRKVGSLYPDIGLGIFMSKQVDDGLFEGDIFYGGLSIPHFFSLSTEYDDPLRSTKYSSVITRHYLGNFGVVKYFDDYRYFELTSWLKYIEDGQLHADVLAKYKMSESFYFGFGASSNLNLLIESGTYFTLSSNSIVKISYSLNNSYFNTALYLPATHEITAQFYLANSSQRRKW